jgi:hypothetical protein
MMQNLIRNKTKGYIPRHRSGVLVRFASNGTADGTTVNMNTCSGALGQKWIFQSDGTGKNPNSGKCLHYSSFTSGAPLEIRTCNASLTEYLWGFPQL